jgi:hypothetical protein
VSVIHLAAGLVIASVFWATKLVKFEVSVLRHNQMQ